MEDHVEPEMVGRMLAAEHLALTALNLYVHARAGIDGEDPVETAKIIAEGLRATFADVPVDDLYRASAMRALKAQGDALVDAARRLKQAMAASRQPR